MHNQGKRTRLRDLIRYDLRQMHAAFTGTLPVGSKAENSLGGAQVQLLALSQEIVAYHAVFCHEFPSTGYRVWWLQLVCNTTLTRV